MKRILIILILAVITLTILGLAISCNPLTGHPVMVVGKNATADTTVFMQYAGGAVYVRTDIPDTNYVLIVFEHATIDTTYRVNVPRDYYLSVHEGQVIKL